MTDLAELLHEIDGTGRHHWRPVTTKQRVADKIHGHWSAYCCCGLFKSGRRQKTVAARLYGPTMGDADMATRAVSDGKQLHFTESPTKGDDDAD